VIPLVTVLTTTIMEILSAVTLVIAVITCVIASVANVITITTMEILLTVTTVIAVIAPVTTNVANVITIITTMEIIVITVAVEITNVITNVVSVLTITAITLVATMDLELDLAQIHKLEVIQAVTIQVDPLREEGEPSVLMLKKNVILIQRLDFKN